MQPTADTIPKDVYVQFVRSLYDNVQMILVGAFCHAIAAYLCYEHTGFTIYLWIAVALIGVGVCRFYSMAAVTKRFAVTDYESARRCEREYVLLGSIQGLTLGFFCVVAIYYHRDPFSEFAALAVTLGSMVTVCGRNYGSRTMVAIFSACFVLPISLSLVLRGSTVDVLLGLLVFPFLFVVKGTADKVRQVLFSAIVGHGQAKQIAQRFDRALNTMSHGLIMLDTTGKVVVANAEAAQTMALASSDRLLGRTLKSLLLRGVAGGILSLKDSRYVETQLARALRDRRDRKLLVSFADGRHFEFSAREGTNELGVITFEDVTARITAEERVRFMARYDNLTGLPNRAYFQEMVAESMAHGPSDRLCMVAVIDLDDFKTINDTLGHPVGDGFIFETANRLRTISSETVQVGRFGGDEFMIYYDRVENHRHAGQLLDALFEALDSEVDVAGHSLKIRASAGAVCATVASATFDTLVVKADLALYSAKDQGKNDWRLFEAAMDEAFRSRQMLKADLRAAVEGRKLRAVYQPIVDLKSMRMASCEALCRWDHPELGAISPAVFIPLAEEIGIIGDISLFMLETACRDCATWPAPVTVSVNLSAKDFRSGDIVDSVREALERSGLDPHRLEIEVTETALLDDKAKTRTFLDALKGLGVQIALDDFGTGYSSLSYLHTLPLDKVKIDRSFMTDLTENDRSMVLLRGIVDLSRPLGLTVTVEGVETFEQLQRLAQEIHPDLLQGFLFGSALTASGIDMMSSTLWPFGKDLRKRRRRIANA